MEEEEEEEEEKEEEDEDAEAEEDADTDAEENADKEEAEEGEEDEEEKEEEGEINVGEVRALNNPPASACTRDTPPAHSPTLGPARYRSPRHRMPRNSIHQGSRRVS